MRYVPVIDALKERIAILEEQRDATHKQVDEILIRRNKRIDELEAELEKEKTWVEKCHQGLVARDTRIEELEEWIRNKRDSNFEFACKHLEGWTEDKDSFYAECTEILERKC